MTSREQKLLILILIVLAYAAVDYFYRAASGFEDAKSVTAQTSEAQAAVAAMTNQIASLPLSENGRRLLELANAPLMSDPLQAPAPAVRSSMVSDLPQVTLSGILRMGRTALALIGGEEYAVGDEIPETGETITAITNDAVTLRTSDRTSTRTLRVTDLEPRLTDLMNPPAAPALP